MFVTIINDCRDANAIARQETRVGALFNTNVTYVPVMNDLEAAGNLIDILDAASDEDGIILVNVAPRNGEAKKWENGTPFAFFKVKNILIIASIDGYTLSLIKKYALVGSIQVMDIPTVLQSVREYAHITDELAHDITDTQFRSFEFLPRVAYWLIEGQNIPSEEMSINEIADIQDAVWWIDNWGNAKTTLWAEDVSFDADSDIEFSIGSFVMRNRLKDVLDNESALIEGSSGYGKKRFLEIVTQGGSAEEKYNLEVGTLLKN